MSSPRASHGLPPYLAALYEFKPDAQVRRQVMTGALQTTLDYKPTFGLHAKSMVVDDHVAQILGYLRSSRIETGLLINFGAARLHVKK